MKLSKETALRSFLIGLPCFLILIGIALLFVFRSSVAESPIFDGECREIAFPVKNECENTLVTAFSEDGSFENALLLSLDRENKTLIYTFFEGDWILEQNGSGFFLRSIMKDENGRQGVVTSLTGATLSKNGIFPLSSLDAPDFSGDESFVRSLVFKNFEILFGGEKCELSFTEKKIVLSPDGDYQTVDVTATLNAFGYTLNSKNQ